MLTTNYVPGAPVWLDLGTTDVEAAASFYGALFGWEFRSAGPEAGGYGMFTLAGKTVAAVGPLTEQGASPAWTTYFHTFDADATAKAVEQGWRHRPVRPVRRLHAGPDGRLHRPRRCAVRRLAAGRDQGPGRGHRPEHAVLDRVAHDGPGRSDGVLSVGIRLGHRGRADGRVHLHRRVTDGRRAGSQPRRDHGDDRRDAQRRDAATLAALLRGGQLRRRGCKGVRTRRHCAHAARGRRRCRAHGCAHRPLRRGILRTTSAAS